MDSRELSIRNRISEVVARSELDAMERDARCALFYPDQPFKIAVRDYKRQARDAVNQAVKDFSEYCEVMMVQEFQGIQNRYEEWKNMKEERHK